MIFTFPVATPVTTPLVASTVATAILLLLQVPLRSPELVNAVVVAPIQTIAAPLMVPALASGLTMITLLLVKVVQLLVTEYVIVVEPAATPDTTPVDGFTVATAVLLLVHVPPASPLLAKGVVWFTQTVDEPLMVPGIGSAFIVMLAETTWLPQSVLVTW